MSDPLNIPLTDDPPYDRDRELVFWMLPTTVDEPSYGGGEGGHREWTNVMIDRLARRYLRYCVTLATSMGDDTFDWALERREVLLDRLERVTIKDRLRYFEGVAVDLVLARAHQIIDPDRFRPIF